MKKSTSTYLENIVAQEMKKTNKSNKPPRRREKLKGWEYSGFIPTRKHTTYFTLHAVTG